MRYNGNLAYDWEYEDNSARIEEEVKKQKAETRKKAKVESVKKHKVLAGCAIVLALCAGLMISRNVAVYESRKNVEDLQKELNSLKEYSSQKAFEIDQNLDLESIEQAARENLNMVKPEKYQTVYVNIKQDDVTEVTADQVEGIGGFFGIFARKR